MDTTDSRSADSQLSPQRVRIDLAERSYDILIGAGLLGREDSYEGLPAGGTAMIVTNTVVAPLYLERLRCRLQACYGRVDAVVLPDGEQYKTLETLARDRALAIGSGVAAAQDYYRGTVPALALALASGSWRVACGYIASAFFWAPLPARSASRCARRSAADCALA